VRVAAVRLWIAVPLFLAVALAPETSDACPVCMSNREASRLAYLGTTIFLSALPLMMVGSGVFWLRRRILEAEQSWPAREPQPDFLGASLEPAALEEEEPSPAAAVPRDPPRSGDSLERATELQAGT
jgi:hypothetical protein